MAALTRITLFTRANCSLCTNASAVLMNVQKRRPFRLDKFDVMEDKNAKWKIYEFDVPVIHVEKLTENAESNIDAKKLMHRFREDEVEKIMDEAENGS